MPEHHHTKGAAWQEEQGNAATTGPFHFKHKSAGRGKTLTVGALGGCVEEEESLVDDTSRGASSADETAHNSSGAPGHKRHHTVCCSAASLH